ncbi:MAG: hypothetical protein J6A65_06160 [Pseudomonas sp.]|nr:hypothetical protein [Pseudomonas sp.]
MISDKTLDEALVELLRTKKALEALRAKRKADAEHSDQWRAFTQHVEHAAAKRASLDLTRKLAELRR